MKKILLVLLSAFFIISCEDTKVTDSALQANIDNNFYMAADARASVNDDGTLTILGSSQNEGMTIKLSSLAENSYTIGEGSSNFAMYEGPGGSVYTTLPDGEGMVTISEVNEVNKTISGIFHFNAILPGIDTIYVSNGTLFDIPYNNSTELDPVNAGTFSAKINDNEFLPFIVSARKTTHRISISANNVNSKITLNFKPDVSTGNYALPNSTVQAIYTNADGSKTTREGVVSLSEHNTSEKTMKGTFSFNTDNTLITEGKFNITYK
ncbi:DUF6252 family protein [Aequorivita sp. KMM 9714]|uniref:DUF6252 family protein n=1 Tax=Aequorivita sp. KMM 9714 TaxID=2707173 RepID=UPI0013ECE72C|nr:DUF6252 family protein [Aequorivita sp. KMM 9714]NGX84419.1 hypothetical protein [Aequorivita sp. KMM 9714]